MHYLVRHFGSGWQLCRSTRFHVAQQAQYRSVRNWCTSREIWSFNHCHLFQFGIFGHHFLLGSRHRNHHSRSPKAQIRRGRTGRSEVRQILHNVALPTPLADLHDSVHPRGVRRHWRLLGELEKTRYSNETTTLPVMLWLIARRSRRQCRHDRLVLWLYFWWSRLPITGFVLVYIKKWISEEYSNTLPGWHFTRNCKNRAIATKLEEIQHLPNKNVQKLRWEKFLNAQTRFLTQYLEDCNPVAIKGKSTTNLTYWHE